MKVTDAKKQTATQPLALPMALSRQPINESSGPVILEYRF